MASYSEVKKFIYKFFGVSDSVSEDSKVIEGTAIRVAKRLRQHRTIQGARLA